MDNPFDQFDAPKKNPFDQFDAKPATSYSFPEGEAGDSLAMQGPISHVLDAFGQGVKQQWGAMTASAGLSQDAQQWMRKNGVWNDYSEGSGSFWKAINEAVMRPAAAALDIYNRQVSPAALLSNTVRQTSDFMIAGGAPRDLTPGAFMEAFPAAHFTGFPANVPIPQSFAGIHSSAVAQALTRARDLGVIGEGDAGWRGIPASPEANAAAIEALTPNRDAIARQVSREPFGPQPAPQIEAPETQPAPDIHAVARQIAPATFAEYDALAMQKQTLHQWVADLREQRGRGTSPEITALDEQIDTLRGQRLEAPPGERAAMANRITAMEAERAKLAEGLPKEGDTPAMARLRRDLQTVDYRMRDLALGDVSDAYRRANEGEVPEAQPTEAPVSPAAEPPATETPAAVTAQPQAEQTPPAQAKAPLEGGIAGDMSRQLVAAGRPVEEADEAAALIQAHYEARAARFGGAKGTAEDLYRAEAPDVRAGRGVQPAAMELAQKGELEQTRRGKIRLATDEAKATITLFNDADASTFIHETGHHWLEELMRDAADERAPPDLIADAATMRQWLGVEDGADIPTRAHERAARGFERYMMEGHAPSEKLAAVFAKFRDWLTSIYQTVARLRSPINDDIRRVFDRMLSAEREGKPVIAPERDISTFADLHEAEAEHTPPEHAIPAADIIEHERDRIAEAVAPEDIHAGRRDSRAATEDRGPEPGNRVPDGGGNAGRPEPTGSVSGAGDGAVSESGSEVAPQRAGVATGATNPAASGAEPSAEPRAPLPPADGRLIDQAGNIKLDNLNTPADVNALLRDMAERNNNFMAARRGVVSDRDVVDLASAMGLRPQDLDIARLRSEFTPERVRATRELFVKTATETQQLSGKAATGSDADVMAYMASRSRLRMVQEYLSALTAETGRGLRAFRKIEGIDQAKDVATIMGDLSESRTLNQLRQEAARVARLETAAQVNGFLRDVDKPGLGAMALELYQNWLISGPITHTTYAAANELLALWKAVPETALAATFDAARAALTGEARTRFYGEVGAQLHGMLFGQRKGFSAAWDSFRSGQTVALPGEVEAAAPGTKAAPSTVFTQRQAIPNFEIAGVPVPLGSVVRVPGERMVAPIHSYFRAVGYEQGIGRLAYRGAMDEGLQGHAFAARVADLTAHPTPEMMEIARDEATQQTLMGKGGSLAARMSQFVNWEAKIPGLGPTRLLRFIDPFVHISANIMEQGALQRGPSGWLVGSIRDDLIGRNGPGAQADAAARMIGGTALSAVAGGLVAQGILSPSAPPDHNEAAMWRLVYGMPHSIRIGQMSYDISRLGVLGWQLGLAADLYHVASVAGKGEDFSKVSSLLVHSIAHNFLSEGGLRGPADLFKALGDPDHQGARWVQNFISSMAVPYSVGAGQIAREIDPYARQARTLMDSIKAKVPWWSQTLMPLRDIWGEPVLSRDWVGLFAKRIEDDPVNQAMMKIGYFPAPPLRQIRGVELTDQQYDDFSRESGRMAKMMANNIVRQPWFAHAPPFVQHEALKNAVEGAREAASAAAMARGLGSDNDIAVKATKMKEEEFRGATSDEIKKMRKVNGPSPAHSGATIH